MDTRRYEEILHILPHVRKLEVTMVGPDLPVPETHIHSATQEKLGGCSGCL
jgi:hypothetical protein